ncbi:MAG TPA: DUF1302 family protein [Rhodocyclaceae bacterium]|nr:DUF1302 family protein [Rhodocyclaceae bacterium]
MKVERKQALMKYSQRIFIGMLLAMNAGFAVAQSRDSLFDDDDKTPPPPATKQSDASVPVAAKKEEAPPASNTRFSGNLEFRATRSIDDPEHWSGLRLRTNLGAQGGSSGLKWKLGIRADADAAYWGRNKNIYPPAVRDDQRTDVELRENYVDTTAGDWDLRLGKQFIVWGEMVGLFVADVVSPRDLRDFVSTDLEPIRRTQWAARAERFDGDWHNEAIWVPVQTYDNIGKPGSEFYPQLAPSGTPYTVNEEERPKRDFDNGSFGLRSSVLKNGWDLSALAYVSRNVSPVFERQITPSGLVFTPVHDRIRQFGGTFSKDVGGVIVHGEGVWSSGKRFTVTRLDDDDGLMRSGSFDYAFGADFTLPADSRLNAQIYQRVLTHHDDTMLVDKAETGASLLYNIQWHRNWEAQMLWATSLNRSEGWINPLLTWKPWQDTRLRLGADFFYGPPTGAFGSLDDKDRVYVEMQQTF